MANEFEIDPAGSAPWHRTVDVAQWTLDKQRGAKTMFGRETHSAYRRAAILSVVVIVSLGIDASAQSTGAFGQRNLGGTITNPQNSFGGTPSRDFEQEGVGQVTGTERFVRDARQPGEFVGADLGDTQNFFSQATSAFQLNNQPISRNNRNANRQNAGQFGGQQSRARILRRRLHVAFRHPQLSSTNVGNSINARLKRLSAPNSPLDIQVAMQGRTAVLQGTVASEEERKLAATLVSLEPGVSAVRNELTVSAERPPIPRVEQVPVEQLPSTDEDAVTNSVTEPAAS